MPYYAPTPTQGSILYDSRKPLPSANFFIPPSFSDTYAPSESTGTFGNVAGQKVGAPIYNGKKLVIVGNTNTGCWELDINTQILTLISNSQTGFNGKIASDNNTAFCVAGTTGTVNAQNCSWYDYTSQTWYYNNLFSFSQLRYGGSLIYNNGYLYLLGGCINSSGYGSDAQSLLRLTASDYDLIDNTANRPPGWVSPWTAMAQPPAAIGVPYGCVSNDGSKIFVTGYLNTSNSATQCLFEYDIASDTWTDHNLTTGIYFSSIHTANNFLFGYNLNDSNAHYYDITNGLKYTVNVGTSGGGEMLYSEFDGSAYFLANSVSKGTYKINPFNFWGINYAA